MSVVRLYFKDLVLSIDQFLNYYEIQFEANNGPSYAMHCSMAILCIASLYAVILFAHLVVCLGSLTLGKDSIKGISHLRSCMVWIMLG